MSKISHEVVHEGWLIKSPPTRRIWRARWRRRWFTLRPSHELPGQYFLEYYTDRNCRKLKGVIDLDQCEQVDAGLRFEQRKLKYQYMFDIKTPSRTYYLAAESENDMNGWVDCICQVCGLKAYLQEEQESVSTTHLLPENEILQESPPVSPISTVSGPYIPISQCITGRPLSPPQNNQNVETLETTPVKPQLPRKQGSCNNSSIDSWFYESPRRHQLPQLEVARSPESYSNINITKGGVSPSLQSPTDSESVFTDEESGFCTLSEKKFTRPSESSADADLIVTKKFTKLNFSDGTANCSVPPRPPKPLHLIVDNSSHNYLNLNGKPSIAERRAASKDSGNKEKPIKEINISEISTSADETKTLTSDEMYDFPRSHQHSISEPERHCYNNAAPVTVPTADGLLFRYDALEDEPASPSCSHSSCSTTAQYSNLPSPLLGPNVQPPATPPAVDRGLKPGRTLSASVSMHSLPDHAIPAPVVDRRLKPTLQIRSVTMTETSHSDFQEYGSLRRRANPSPLPVCLSYLHGDMLDSITSLSTNFDKMQYLDLDHEYGAGTVGSLSSLQPPRSPSSTTVYKKVDFLKTEAFNRTKQKLEAERKQCS